MQSTSARFKLGELTAVGHCNGKGVVTLLMI